MDVTPTRYPAGASILQCNRTRTGGGIHVTDFFGEQIDLLGCGMRCPSQRRPKSSCLRRGINRMCENVGVHIKTQKRIFDRELIFKCFGSTSRIGKMREGR